MPLTPADVYNTTFHRAALGKRGYDADEVDALREEAGQEMARLRAERDALRARLQNAGTDTAEVELAAVSEALDRELRARDRSARVADGLERQLNEARNAAPVNAAPVEQNEQVLQMARRTADEHVRDADHESDQVLAEARERSDRLVREARQAAYDIEQAALRQDEEDRARLTERHAALVHEIAELGEFAESYRAALEGHIRHQGEL
ncbi:DivIVA domain-containing protein [Actinoplanes sp. HUAS TT8]|uniref:DivIVA domain-containing protein n=1 Tax=Actinoplanes sp. HUAS TT8 TaxID=3447453 RepID=UPI003F51E2B7